MRNVITVIGDAKIDETSLEYKLAFETGKALVDNGYRVQSGGLNGVMKAVFAGAKASSKYVDGDTIAIVPSYDRNSANEYADIVIPTGLDIMRNALVVNSNAVIAFGGGAGTLSEMAIAWSLGKLIIAFNNVGGWSAKLSNQKIDDRIRYEYIDGDCVYGVDSSTAAIEILNKNIQLYTKVHEGIFYRK